jgi:hypothetical protein
MIQHGSLQRPDRNRCVDSIASTDVQARLIAHETDDSGKWDFLLETGSSAGKVTCGHRRDHSRHIHVHGASCHALRGTFLHPTILWLAKILLFH